MNEKERFDACMQQANYGAGRHDGRRDYEWKVTLGLWALIAGAAIYQDRWSQRLPLWALFVICALILGAYGYLWLYPLWKENAIDQAVANHFRVQAARILQDPNHSATDLDFDKVDISFSTFLSDWSMRFQLVGTALLFAFLLILTRG